MRRVATALIAVVVACLAVAPARSQTATPYPFAVENPKNIPFPQKQAEHIFFLACRRVAESVNIEHPPKLDPVVTVHLGSDRNRVMALNGRIDIYMVRYDGLSFAAASVIAAHDAIISVAKQNSLARSVYIESQQVLDVEQERTGGKN